MARIIIADAGPLIALSAIDGLSILRLLFSEVTVTESVKDECLAKTGLDAQRIHDGYLKPPAMQAVLESAAATPRTTRSPSPPRR